MAKNQSKSKRTTFTVEEKLLHEIVRERNHVFHRFPFLFAFLSTFGLVAVFYGMEHLIDQSTWLVENPLVMLGVGILTLAFTGALYKKLG